MSGGSSKEGTTAEDYGTCDAKGCECQNKHPEKPKTVISRADVYKAIDTEREYQDKKWVFYDDSDWAVNDWVVFIKRYLKEINEWTGHKREQMDAMRKVAALAVCSMEYNGTRPRIYNGKK